MSERIEERVAIVREIAIVIPRVVHIADFRQSIRGVVGISCHDG